MSVLRTAGLAVTVSWVVVEGADILIRLDEEFMEYQESAPYSRSERCVSTHSNAIYSHRSALENQNDQRTPCNAW
jgi:hypothetical protein